MSEEKNITAIILAGGNSSRMKTDKGLLKFKNKLLTEHVLDAVKKFCNIIIITHNSAYQKFGYPCFKDEMKDKGALGGIYSGLIHSNTLKNFVLGCDMPFISENILQSLFKMIGEEDVLLTEHLGKAEPLCSVYSKNCITHFGKLLEKNQLKITDSLTGLKTRTVCFDHESWFRGNEFVNINTEEEFQKYINQ